MPENSPSFLPPGGNYRELLSYRKSEIIYDFTFHFCGDFLKKKRWDGAGRPFQK